MEYSSVDYQTKEIICSMDCKTSKKYFNPVFFVLKNAKRNLKQFSRSLNKIKYLLNRL